MPGDEIASAYVTLRLDPAEFAEQLDATLSGSPDRLPIKAELNSEEFENTVAYIQDQIAGLEAEGVRLELSLSGDGDADLKLKDVRANADLLRASLKDMTASLNDEEFLSKMLRLQEDVAALDEQLRQERQLDIVTEEANAALNEFKLRIAELKADLVDNELGLNTSLAQEDILRIKAEIDLLTASTNELRLIIATGDDARIDATLLDISTKLEALSSKDWTVEVQAQVNSEQLDAQLLDISAKIASLRTELALLQNLNVNLSPQDEARLAQLKAELAYLTAGKREIELEVEDDLAIAKVDELYAQLALLESHDWTAHVTTDDDSASGWEKWASGVSASTEGFSKLVTVVSAGAPLIVSAAGEIAAAWTILPGIFSGIGLALAALESAGVPKVAEALLQENKQPSTDAAERAATNAQNNLTATQDAQNIITARQAVATALQTFSDEQIQNAQAVQAAEYDATSTVEQGQDAVRQAIEGVTEATWQQQQAQEALTTARQNAVFALQNYVNQLKDARLAEEGDSLSIRQAREQLQTARITPQARGWQLAIEQAQLGVEQAIQSARDQHTATQQLQIEAQEAFAQGVAGNPSVQQAQEALVESQWAEVNAVRSEKEAIQALAQTKITATEDVANALQQQQQQQQQNVQAVQNAEKSLSLAIQQENVARLQQISGLTSSTSALQQDLSALTPIERQFVDYWRSNVSPLITELEDKSQADFWSGSRQGIKDLEKIIQEASPFIIQAAAGISQTLQQVGGFLSSPTGQSELHTLFTEGNDFFQTFGGTFLTGLEGWMKMGVDAEGLVHSWAVTLDTMATGLTHFFEGSGGRDFVAWVQEVSPEFGTFLRDFGKGLLDVAGGIAAITPASFKILDSFLGALDKVLNIPGVSAVVGALIELRGVLGILSALKITALLADLVRMKALFEGAEGVKAASFVGKFEAAIGKFVHGSGGTSTSELGANTGAIGANTTALEALTGELRTGLGKGGAGSSVVGGGGEDAETTAEEDAETGGIMALLAKKFGVGEGSTADTLGLGTEAELGGEFGAGGIGVAEVVSPLLALVAGFAVGSLLNELPKLFGGSSLSTDIANAIESKVNVKAAEPNLAPGTASLQKKLAADESALKQILAKHEVAGHQTATGKVSEASKQMTSTWVPAQKEYVLPRDRSTPALIKALQADIKKLNSEIHAGKGSFHELDQSISNTGQSVKGLIGKYDELTYKVYGYGTGSVDAQEHVAKALYDIADAASSESDVDLGLNDKFTAIGTTGEAAFGKVGIAAQVMRSFIGNGSNSQTATGALQQFGQIGEQRIDDVKGAVKQLTAAFPNLKDAVVKAMDEASRQGGTLNEQLRTTLRLIEKIRSEQSNSRSGIRRLPGRAGGGGVYSGQSYWVGEAGPEVFTPSSSGYITPNSSVASGGASASNFLVRVYIGEQELTQIIRTEVSAVDAQAASSLGAGSVL